MTKEKKNEFTLKISQANRSEIIVLLYDIALEYIDEAKTFCDEKEYIRMRESCGYAGKVVSDLIGALRYDNGLAILLRNSYTYIQSLISMAVIKRRKDELEKSEKMLKGLRESFKKVAMEDTSSPVMGNTEAVYAGLTYGKKAYLDSLTTEVTRGYTV